MLNQPINVVPSVLSGAGEGVIDATKPLTVSWQVSGDTPLLAYRIVIQQNDTSSTQVFTTGKVTLTNPFYGNDRSGNVQTFSADEITAAQLSTAGIVNGYANGYKMVITQWWGATDDDSISQTSPSYFITRATPTVSISLPSYTELSPYTMKSITANAVFSQAQGDTVKTVRWRLYEGQISLERNLLVDTGDMETQLLQFYYDGLFPNTYYYLTISIQTSNGVSVEDEHIIFVNYELGENVGDVSVCKPAGEDYIEVSWGARSSIDATVLGDIEFDNGEILIGDDSSITYSTLNIAPTWSIVWKGSADLSDGVTRNIATLSDGTNTYEFNLSSSSATFTLNGNIIISEEIVGHSVDKFTFVVTPSSYVLRQDTFSGGTIPSESLYPSTTLYPSDVSESIVTFDGEISYTQYGIKSIVLSGEQSCDYIWVESGELSQEELENIADDASYQPIADYNTMFLSVFDGGTTTAYKSGTGGNGIGSAIYRKESGKSILEHIVDTEGDITFIRDYGAKARTEYQYFVFSIGSSAYIATLGSKAITPHYNNYTLMECLFNEEDGAYHVQAAYPFACNANQSAISNNNAPNVLRNFTRYPNRQPVNSRYASGTLSALIGSVNQNTATYNDSWELADRISALSTSNNPKFLRDMKGKIWRVETSDAIVTEISTRNKFMPIKVTIPWVEVGSAEGVSIIAVAGDFVYATDGIYLTSVHIDVETGRLIWETPDDYVGTILSLKNSNLESTVPSGVYPATLVINDYENLIANT